MGELFILFYGSVRFDTMSASSDGEDESLHSQYHRFRNFSKTGFFPAEGP
jgi:hypothetical protein